MNYKSILTSLLPGCEWNAQQGCRQKKKPKYSLIVTVPWILNHSKVVLMESAFSGGGPADRFVHLIIFFPESVSVSQLFSEL